MLGDPELGSNSIAGVTPRVGDTERLVEDVAAASTGTYSGNVTTSSHGAWSTQLVALRAR